MLSPAEFTVGTIGSAQPLSLVLPRTKYEETALIGHFNDEPAAVFLSGDYAFQCLPSAGNNRFGGLIVPNVRIEVDETSVFDPRDARASPGAIIRTNEQLVIRALGERSSASLLSITLQSGLPPTVELTAGFQRWQIVIGEGQAKRVLWQTNEGD